jgi:hypothetical protein
MRSRDVLPKDYALCISGRNSSDLFTIVPTFAGCFDKASQGDYMYSMRLSACLILCLICYVSLPSTSSFLWKALQLIVFSKGCHEEF